METKMTERDFNWWDMELRIVDHSIITYKPEHEWITDTIPPTSTKPENDNLQNEQ